MVTKPCQNCGHPKTKHRKYECAHMQQRWAASWTGRQLLTTWCKCHGYVAKT